MGRGTQDSPVQDPGSCVDLTLASISVDLYPTRTVPADKKNEHERQSVATGRLKAVHTYTCRLPVA
jgi:hypothetical protein